MKKLLFLTLTIVPLLAWGKPAIAAEHGAHCFNGITAEMKDCRVIVNLEENTLEMVFKSEEHQQANLMLAGDQIQEISTGEYAKKRMTESIAAGIILGPLGGLVGLFYKENRTQIALEYVDAQNRAQVTMIDIPTNYSEPLETDLKNLTGLSIQSE